MRKNLVLLNLIVILALTLGACGGAATPQPAPAAPAPTQAPAAAAPTQAPAAVPAADKKLTIALSIPGLQFPFFVFMEQQVKDEAAKLGNIEIITLDGQNQVPKQTADLEAAIAKKVDGVLVSPITAEGMAPAVKEVVDAGIPVATIDRTVYNVDTLAHVGADNVLGGEQQGKALLAMFPNGATIFELQGTPGATPAIDRSKGLHNVIDSHPEIKVACQQTGEFARDKGLTVTENCLGATPKPDAIVAANDDMALGAVEALKAAKLSIPVIGYDALPESLGMVRDGALYGTVDQFPGQQSRKALDVLVENLRKGGKPATHDIFITPKLITKDNIAEAERISEAPGGAPAAAGADKKLTIALSIPGLQFPFFVFMEQQVKEEAAKLGNIEIITLDGQNQVPKQTADLEAAIAKKVDGVLVSPITAEGMAPGVKEVVDAGIPVATIDRTVYNVDTLAHVGADNVLGGEQQGKALLAMFPNGATIFELQGTPGATPAIDRSKGLHNVIDSHPEIKVACQQTGEFARDKGLTVTENCLGATPKPDAIVAANDDMALGAAEALKAAKLSIPVIGYDALPESLGMVRDGALYGTVDQFPGQQSRKALDVLVENLRKGGKPATHDIFITPKLITKDNIAEAERISEAPGGAPAAAGADKKLTIALSIPGLQFPFFVFMEQQVKDEAAKLGNIEIITLDGQNQVPKQTADLEAAIAKKVDGVLVSPITAEGMAPGVKEVVDAGIPVATIDRTVYNVDTLAHVGADNVLGGEQQGKALLAMFPNGATIFELQGTPGATPAIDRSKGLHNVIDSHPEIKVACQQTGEFARDKGLTVTENCLGATPKPDAIIAANDDMALGAAEALKGANLSIPVIGYDALPESLGMIKSGALYGTVDQFPGEQSRTALRTLVDFLRKGAKPATHDIFITPKLITKDNINDAERIAEVK